MSRSKHTQRFVLLDTKHCLLLSVKWNASTATQIPHATKTSCLRSCGDNAGIARHGFRAVVRLPVHGGFSGIESVEGSDS